VFSVRKLTELEDTDEIYIDTLFPELYDEALELLKRGTKVYLLKDTIKLKKLRIENHLRRSDENDAMLLAQIPREKFRPLTVEELELKVQMRPLIRKYRWIVRWERVLKKFMKHGFNYNFEEVIRLMEADRKKVSKEIIRQVASLPIYGEVYRKACEILGIGKSTDLAILTLELPLYLPLVKLKKFLGLIPDRNRGEYNHRLRTHIAAFAAYLYLSVKKGVSVSDKVAEIVNHLPKRQAIPKLELMTLKALRITYLMTTNPTAGG